MPNKSSSLRPSTWNSMRRSGIAAAFLPQASLAWSISGPHSANLLDPKFAETTGPPIAPTSVRRGEITMKPFRLRVLGSLIGGAFLTLATPSHAASSGRGFSHSPVANSIRSDRSDIRQDRQDLSDNRMDLNQDRQELREDRRDGASRGEIGNDRSDIRQDRRDIVRDRQDLRGDRRDLRQDLQQEHRSFFDRWHSWWNR
jgi:hypothetical protein